MTKYKKQQPSAETVDEAMKIARATQKPNQSKEQTKLIAQGIQKGIAEYKKQQKGKIRELNKLKKQFNTQKESHPSSNDISDTENNETIQCKTQWLPWTLLIISWIVFAVLIGTSK
ncbi:MAG: DUF2956 domain-containing protein [Gammaproteobacteria bacterium]|nr:DUF2956 domain-containing protein [Gammaproteobacteria bacterium]